MKESIKRLVNSALGSVGLTLARTETFERSNRYIKLEIATKRFIEQVEEQLQKGKLSSLPEDKKRADLMIQNLNVGFGALYILDCLHQTLHLEGDVFEMGIAYGGTSVLLANEIRPTTKHLWLFDSFQGLSKPTEKDILINDIAGLGSMDKYEGMMAHSMETVLKTVSEAELPKERLHLVPGYMEQSVHTPGLPEKVCFAYVDFDLYEPIKTGLELLDKKIVPGGIIIVDDYGYFSSGAKTAVDEFVAENEGRYTFHLGGIHRNGIATLTRTHRLGADA